jgi:ribosomal protein L11 methyltransferase
VSWLELSVDVDPEAVESVSELLAQEGYNGGVVIDQPILPDVDGPEYAYDTSRPVTLRTYLPLDEHAAAAQARIEHALWHLGRMRPVGLLRVQQLEEQDWADAWKQHYTIQRIGEYTVVVPSWLEYTAQPGDLVLQLDPGMAFGTGLHPTTQLCITLLERYVRPGSCVLDLGCGSGILAITAAKLGAHAVLALDTDPIAVDATRENAVRNGVAERVQVAAGSLGGGAALGHWLYPTTDDRRPTTDDRHEGQSTDDRRPIADDGYEGRWSVVGGPWSYDVIVANIIARVLAALAEGMAAALAPGGMLIVSGIIAEREDEAVAAFAAAGLVPRERHQEGDWVALVYARYEQK